MNKKKFFLVLFTLVPILAGYIVNLTIMVPYIGMFFFYVIPLIVLAFWFYLGALYSKTDWRPFPAILIGNFTGVISLGLYCWQFLLRSDETRSMFIAGFSQMFSVATPIYLFGKIALLFESQPNYSGQTTMLVLQIIAVIFMCIVFTFGYFIGRKHNKSNTKPFEK